MKTNENTSSTTEEQAINPQTYDQRKEYLISIITNLNNDEPYQSVVSLQIIKKFFINRVLEECTDRQSATSYLQDIFNAAGITEHPFATAALHFIPASFGDSSEDDKEVLFANIFKNEDFMHSLNMLGALYARLIPLTDKNECKKTELDISAIQGSFARINDEYPSSNLGFNSQNVQEIITIRLIELFFDTLRTNETYRKHFLETIANSAAEDFLNKWLYSADTQNDSVFQKQIYQELLDTMLPYPNTSKLTYLKNIVIAHIELRLTQNARMHNDGNPEVAYITHMLTRQADQAQQNQVSAPVLDDLDLSERNFPALRRRD